MSKIWSKEDRNSFNNSEVMREFEKKIIENYNKLIIAQNEYELRKMSGMAEEVNKVKEAVEGLDKALSADDGELENNAETIDTRIVVSPENEEVGVKTKNEAEDEEIEKKAKEETLLKLYHMARKAALEGNIKLAYKIERTISELSEE